MVWQAGRRLVLASVALDIFTAVSALIAIGFTRRAIGQLGALEPGGAVRPLATTLALLGIVSAFAAVSSANVHLVRRLLQEKTTAWTTLLVAERAERAPLIDFERADFHNGLMRATRALSSRPAQVAYTGTLTAGGLVGLVGLMVALLNISVTLTATVVLAIVPLWLAMMASAKLAVSFEIEDAESNRRRYYLQNLLTVRAHTTESRSYDLGPELLRRLHAAWQARLGILVRNQKRLAVRTGVLQLLSVGLLMVAGLLTVREVGNGNLSSTDAVVALAVVGLIRTRGQGVLSAIGMLHEAALDLGDIRTFLDGDRSGAEHRRPAAAWPSVHVVVDNVSFQYPDGTQALAGISAEFLPGELVALVGPNGSGKTTLSTLIAGLHEPTNGSVRWNGIDPASLDVGVRRAQAALHAQEPVRYQLSVRDNVVFGRAGVDEPLAVDRAVDAAGMSEVIESLANGHETTLGPEFTGGTSLSGGQWQRLASARAFYRDTPLLVLDEPASTLDAFAEARLFDSLRAETAERTVVVVSHRLSNLHAFDKIYVLQHGLIVEAGNHHDLLARNGLYAELYRTQAEGFAVGLPTAD